MQDPEDKENYEVYAEFFENEPQTVLKPRFNFWVSAKRAFTRAGKMQKKFTRLAQETVENVREKAYIRTGGDSHLNAIEFDRLKQLTLLQTFDVYPTELENVSEYEHFNDCLDTFPLYKGKGSSRSDEIGDEKRVFVKFKGKLRIREVPAQDGRTRSTSAGPPRNLVIPEAQPSHIGNSIRSLDFNKNPIIMKCRLYLIKAVLFRAWDASGRADPYLKIFLNNQIIIDDQQNKLHNTLEPIFGR
ncbi:unnamed protein product [Didymodactylos carnosus]|uniref:Uncharacterized protein n=1 Tax=Didymodactylos carnosus TaxID=1234261 RepID=A0A815SE92_9BILA|nr:unnamed protein product [Didymodactylos carnosus]CAF1490800.1 unnamed protein product [Didymodactylos carnosus]CAF3983307.1 unnamed protein product [Didymodactylos carnosus]CAF4353835.1 unnamed protein product [Didymodactylos carnosus]